MGDAGRVGVARAVFVNEGSVEFHVGGRCSRTLVLVRDADVVVATVLRNGCRHAVVVHGAVHAAAAGELTVVGVVVGGGTALALVGSIAEVSIGSTAGGPRPVVRSDVACTGRVGLAEGSGHVRDVDVFVRMVSFDGVMRVGATARLRAVAAIVGGDVLAEDDVAGTGGVRAVRLSTTVSSSNSMAGWYNSPIIPEVRLPRKIATMAKARLRAAFMLLARFGWYMKQTHSRPSEKRPGTIKPD